MNFSIKPKLIALFAIITFALAFGCNRKPANGGNTATNGGNEGGKKNSRFFADGKQRTVAHRRDEKYEGRGGETRL